MNGREMGFVSALDGIPVGEYRKALEFARGYSKAYRFLREKEEKRRLGACQARIALRVYLRNGFEEDAAWRNILKFFNLPLDTAK